MNVDDVNVNLNVDDYTIDDNYEFNIQDNLNLDDYTVYVDENVNVDQNMNVDENMNANAEQDSDELQVVLQVYHKHQGKWKHLQVDLQVPPTNKVIPKIYKCLCKWLLTTKANSKSCKSSCKCPQTNQASPKTKCCCKWITSCKEDPNKAEPKTKSCKDDCNKVDYFVYDCFEKQFLFTYFVLDYVYVLVLVLQYGHFVV
nr:hypothetical protein [Tanacetum cinerariifolium]